MVAQLESLRVARARLARRSIALPGAVCTAGRRREGVQLSRLAPDFLAEETRARFDVSARPRCPHADLPTYGVVRARIGPTARVTPHTMPALHDRDVRGWLRRDARSKRRREEGDAGQGGKFLLRAGQGAAVR